MEQVTQSYNSYTVLASRVHGLNCQDIDDQVLAWAQRSESRAIGLAAVNQIMLAIDSSDYRARINALDLNVPDGVPLVWILRALGKRGQTRVYGPDLMLRLCERAAQQGVPIGLYGGHSDVLEQLHANLERRFPGIRIVYAYSPPFRKLTAEEDSKVVEDINQSGAKILFVGLGAPKHDYWTVDHRHKINAVMLGVGAAFNFHAGRLPQAPSFLQKIGMEWFFRLCSEPRRLWRRYLIGNIRFLGLLFLQTLGLRKF